MKHFWKLLSLSLALLATACVPSLHSLYTESDLIFDKKLLGHWVDDDSSWIIKKGSNQDYEITMIDSDQKTGNFEGHLLQLGEHKFLDLYPIDPELESNDFFKFHLVPTHTFAWIQYDESKLSMRFMHIETISAILTQHPDAIKHERIEDRVLLTASTKDLQAFILKHMHDEKFFIEPSEYQRQL